MEASTEDTSTEPSVNAFMEASTEVTSTEAFVEVNFLPRSFHGIFNEAFTEALTEVFVEVYLLPRKLS